MDLRDLLYKRFSEAEGLIRYLAVYAGAPAIFSPAAPGDAQEGWGGRPQYPRIIFNYEMQAAAERKSKGVLHVFLFYQETAEGTTEAIEPEIKNCLQDVLLKPENKPPYAFAWTETNREVVGDCADKLITRTELRFDLLEYGCQETADPDPVSAMNQYVKELYPEAFVLGPDRMGEILPAADDRPVIYCRLAAAEREQETNTVVWMDGKIAVHFLCPDAELRMKMAAGMVNTLSLDGEIIMQDQSAMSVKQLQADYGADCLRNGQLLITVRYGLLKYMAKPHTLRQVELKDSNR